MQLGSTGVWSGVFRQEKPEVLKAAAEIEDLGYGAIWMPGGQHAGLADHLQNLLKATRRAVVATGIVSIWTHPASATAATHHALEHAFPDRFLLGIGISHQRAVEGAGITYAKPLSKLREYLEELDAAPQPVPVDERILASLGPLSLKLARDRSLGTHPYFMPVEHTRISRAAVGPGKIVAPEQMVVLETNAERARTIARAAADRYLHAPNYVNNLLRLGFTDADIANGGSERLIDALIAWGEPAVIAQRIAEHHAAGADHVCIQVLTETPGDLDAAMAGWRQLAPALNTLAR
ncbi:MAG: TIGR03620 family F420-dependent LLM class oxidoreductase [Chloroflexi bacterium]|nr:TIGR03620 family F420-dependent LLM class oxidoreductase [Chloroflexota bacterium]MBV9600693.1 TIGR03620 family F420-dependent LLM class oxidoreductase [Chloroflexota bacterium]